jgi:hypothetical protein
MAQTNDTIDGLLAEFRGYSAGMPPSYHVTMSWHDFRVMLDRIEAAHRRERVAASRMREAIEEVIEIANEEWDARRETSAMWEMMEICTAALAMPARNCDALTADERTHKFIKKWEKAHGESIDGKTIIYLSSFSRWLQLPCEREAAK